VLEKMNKFLVLIIIAVYVQKQSLAQLQGQGRIDSLLGQLPKANEDTNKVKLLIDLIPVIPLIPIKV
jgi:hypothetical protein